MRRRRLLDEFSELVSEFVGDCDTNAVLLGLDPASTRQQFYSTAVVHAVIIKTVND